MFLVSAVLVIPQGEYALEMTRKGHGATAINNTFSSQILNICLGLGLPMLIEGIKLHAGVTVPQHKIVAQAAVLLSLGSIGFIGMTLVPALIRHETNCELSTMAGGILFFLTIALLALFVFISIRAKFSVWFDK